MWTDLFYVKYDMGYKLRLKNLKFNVKPNVSNYIAKEIILSKNLTHDINMWFIYLHLSSLMKFLYQDFLKMSALLQLTLIESDYKTAIQI